RSAFSDKPSSARASNRGEGFGSRTEKAEGGIPPASQPSSRAEPILPQPSSTTPRPARSESSICPPIPGRARSGKRGPVSGPTVGLGHGDSKRVLRRLAAPADELECRVEPLTGHHAAAHHVVDLR